MNGQQLAGADASESVVLGTDRVAVAVDEITGLIIARCVGISVGDGSVAPLAADQQAINALIARSGDGRRRAARPVGTG